METTMRRMLIATALTAATFCVGTDAARAYEGPWCALENVGGNTVRENCSMRTLEMCVQEVIAGNRGFCNPNPRWQGTPEVRRSGRRRSNY
jgi:hypothetical protein